MPADPHLIDRSGDLKGELVEFAQQRRCRRELKRALGDELNPIAGASEAAIGSFLDHFILEHRLKDGRTVVERFVDEHPALPEAEQRASARPWRNDDDAATRPAR